MRWRRACRNSKARASVDEADKLVTAEFTAKYPNWAASVRISGAVKAFYAEL